MKSLTIGELKKIIADNNLPDDMMIVVKSMDLTDWAVGIESAVIGVFENGGYSDAGAANNLVLDLDLSN